MSKKSYELTQQVDLMARIAIIGHGAREHALAYKLACNNAPDTRAHHDVMVIGGNAGMAREFECLIKPHTIADMVALLKKLACNLVVIGPEHYLAEGLVDALEHENIPTFGPKKNAAMLESSKIFMKHICARALVPNASYGQFQDYEHAAHFIKNHPSSRLVIKIDALCAGKGVFVGASKEGSLDTLNALFHKGGFAALGLSEGSIIIEDFLSGHEVSVFAAVSKNDAVLFSPMQDYKRLKNNDQGPNTGGMGAVGPLGLDKQERKLFLEHIKETIFLPVLHTMSQENTPFSGLLYAGLMLTDQGCKLLEFNARFGDPETQALLFGLKTDIFPLLQAVALNEHLDAPYWQQELLDMDPALAIVAASSGYPFGNSLTSPLTLPKNMPHNSKIFFAHTKMSDEQELFSQEGRVVNVVAKGLTIEEARSLGYKALAQVHFMGMHHRSDIGSNLTPIGLNKFLGS